jgi:hypothetical protein
VGRHVGPLGHIIPIPSQPIVAYESCVLSGESENTNLIVFDLQHLLLLIVDAEIYSFFFLLHFHEMVIQT